MSLLESVMFRGVLQDCHRKKLLEYDQRTFDQRLHYLLCLLCRNRVKDADQLGDSPLAHRDDSSSVHEVRIYVSAHVTDASVLADFVERD